MQGIFLIFVLWVDFQLDSMFLDQVHDFIRWWLVRYQSMDVQYIAQLDHYVPMKLGMIRHEKYLSGIFHDRPGNIDLPEIKIQEGSIFINAADSDDTNIHLELPDKLDG